MSAMEKLKEQGLTLRDDRVVLHQMSEDEWDIVLRWNSDPEVLYFSEMEDVSADGRCLRV